MHGPRRFLIAASIGFVAPLSAQVVAPLPAPLPLVVQPAPLPATRLEGFQPEAGSVVTMGFDDLGAAGRGRISMDVREVRDAGGHSASGVAVFVTENPERQERAFVDADELPDLLKGLDAVLEVTGNPTQFRKFETRYVTKGQLAFFAYSNASGAIEYAVQAGRPLPVFVRNLDAGEMQKLRVMFDTALQKLAANRGR